MRRLPLPRGWFYQALAAQDRALAQLQAAVDAPGKRITALRDRDLRRPVSTRSTVCTAYTQASKAFRIRASGVSRRHPASRAAEKRAWSSRWRTDASRFEGTSIAERNGSGAGRSGPGRTVRGTGLGRNKGAARRGFRSFGGRRVVSWTADLPEGQRVIHDRLRRVKKAVG